MNAFVRFFSIGGREIDQRVARVLAAPPLERADRYLGESAIVRAIDRATLRLTDWWNASTTARMLNEYASGLAARRWTERYRMIAVTLFTAVATHIVLTLVQGPRPGWFWMVIPAMAIVLATFALLASSRSES